MNFTDSLENVQVGDWVIKTSHQGDSLLKVTKVTKTHIYTGNWQWKRSSGYMKGHTFSRMDMGSPRIIPVQSMADYERVLGEHKARQMTAFYSQARFKDDRTAMGDIIKTEFTRSELETLFEIMQNVKSRRK